MVEISTPNFERANLSEKNIRNKLGIFRRYDFADSALKYLAVGGLCTVLFSSTMSYYLFSGSCPEGKQHRKANQSLSMLETERNRLSISELPYQSAELTTKLKPLVAYEQERARILDSAIAQTRKEIVELENSSAYRKFKGTTNISIGLGFGAILLGIAGMPISRRLCVSSVVKNDAQYREELARVGN